MATADGVLSRLYFNRETTVGVPALFVAPSGPSTGQGLKMYFESHEPDLVLEELTYREVTGSATPDHKSFVPGPNDHRFPLNFALRYSGVHAVLLGAAIGELGTTGPTGSQWTHTADGSAGNQLRSYTFFQQLVMNETGSSYADVKSIGSKCNTMRLSQGDDGLIRVSMEWMGMQPFYSTTFTNPTTLPPDTDGYAPDEELIRSGHIKFTSAQPTGSLIYTRRGGPAIVMSVVSWELTQDNRLGRQSLIRPSGSWGGVEASRDDTRTITGRFTVETQDNLWDQINTAAGLTVADANTDSALTWGYELPGAATSYDCDFTCSNVFITRVQRGTPGVGPLRLSFEFRAGAPPSGLSNNPLAWPLSVAIRNLRQKPVNSVPIDYGAYV